MRPALTIILVICWMQIAIHPAKCDGPEVSRRRMLIYRIAKEVDVDVVQCKYYDQNHPALTYYDITKNCVVASNTGIFVDKWEERNYVNAPVSYVDMKQYAAKADLVRNEIKLRSGTVCRYDRGFCYDAQENENYAAVWKVKRRTNTPVNSCPRGLEQLFYGPVDIWDFTEKRLKYLVFSDSRGQGFYLRLVKKINCGNIETWVTAGDSFVVSSLKLTPTLKDTSVLNQHYFPLKPLKSVGEAVMKNVELQEYPLDFNDPMSTVYFEEPENTRILFQKLRNEMETKIKSVPINTKGGSSNTNNYLSEINNLKQSIVEKTNEIKDILKKLQETENDLRVTKNDVSSFQNLINSYSKTYNENIVDFNDTLSEINRNIQSESERISKLIAAKNREFTQKLEQLNSFVQNQVINLSTNSQLAGKVSNLEAETNKLLKEQTTQLNILLEKNRNFEQSVNMLRNGKTDLEEDLKNVKDEYDSKLSILEQQVNENFNLVENNFTKLLEQIAGRNSASEVDAKIADLRKYIEDFKTSSKSDSETSFNNIRATINTISLNSITREEFLNLQAEIDVLNRNIADVEWDFLKNIKDNPISPNILKGELSALKDSLNKNIEKLKQEFTKKLAQQGSRCSCKEELKKVVENFEKALAAMQSDILQKTNSLVETTKKEIESEITGQVILLRGQIDINRGQLVQVITNRLLEKDKRINELEKTLSDKIKKLQQDTDEVSRNVSIILNPPPNPNQA